MHRRTSPRAAYRFDGRCVYGALCLFLLASLWNAAGYAQGATAASHMAAPPLTKVETTRVCQLTGQYDEMLDRPTVNETWDRFRLGGTDLGPSFLHQGRLWFLFGDALPTGPQENNGLNHACGDAVAHAMEPQRDPCPGLDFVTHPGTSTFRSPVVPGVDLGCFNVPTDGTSIDDAMYVWFTTGTMTRSLLSRSDDEGQTFTPVYAFSDHHFINVSAEQVALPPDAGLPPQSGDWILLFGSGTYRQSEVYLAAVPANQIEDKTAIHYFAGLDPATGQPSWRNDESAAHALFAMGNPCVGELSVHFDATLRLWMLLYNCADPRGIQLQTAARPWGPWSTPEVIFHPWGDDGYCQFIHKACTPQQGDCCDDLAPPGQEGTWGGEYGPYLIEPLTEIDEANEQVTLYYVMSTWVPYNIVVMRTILDRAASSLYVDDDNTTGTEDGSAQRPFDTLQEAVDAALAGDVIHVAAGTYTENVRIQDKAVVLQGGYAGGSAADYSSGTGGDFSNRTPATNISHVQGDGTDATLTLLNAGTSTVDGFRITGGSGSTAGLPYFALGGGLYIEGGAPTIANNVVEANDSRRADIPSIDDTEGGGVYATDADITLTDNIIRNNTSGRGAGVALFGGTVVVRRNTIEGNVGMSDHGGGLEIGAPTAEISHNLIRGNEVGRDLGYGWGGGLSFFNPGNTAMLAYNVVTGNYAPTAGAGVFIDDGAEAVLMHELIYDNQCSEIGGAGIYVDGGDGVRSKATLMHVTVADHNCPDSQGGNGLLLDVLSEATVSNSIFWGNGGEDFEADSASPLAVSYTLSQESIAGTGNLSADPLFANPGVGDYHLRSSGGRWEPTSTAWMIDTNDSPAIDVGDPAAAYANEPAPNGGQVNLGAYGNTAEASKAVAGGMPTENGLDVPQTFALYQNHPNPFNPVTTIRYAVPLHTHVVLKVYDVLGREVATLVDASQPIGHYEVRFDAAGLPTGIYLYRLEAGPFTEDQRMLLVK